MSDIEQVFNSDGRPRPAAGDRVLVLMPTQRLVRNRRRKGVVAADWGDWLSVAMAGGQTEMVPVEACRVVEDE